MINLPEFIRDELKPKSLVAALSPNTFICRQD